MAGRRLRSSSVATSTSATPIARSLRKVKEACPCEQSRGVGRSVMILAASLNELFYGQHATARRRALRLLLDERERADHFRRRRSSQGCPQAPSLYDPLSIMAAALARRNEVLARDASARYITQYSSPRGGFASRPQPGRCTRAASPELRSAGRRTAGAALASASEAGGLQVRTTRDLVCRPCAHRRGERCFEKTDPAAALVANRPRTGAVRSRSPRVLDGKRTLKFTRVAVGAARRQ